MRFQTAVLSGWLRRGLLRRLTQRLRRSSRPSGLFYPVCLAAAGGLVCAVSADSKTPGFALDSLWLYRAEVGLAFMGAIYIAGLTLWLAWHGGGFFELGAFGLTLKASDAENIEALGTESSDAVEKVSEVRRETVGALKELDERVLRLEDRAAP